MDVAAASSAFGAREMVEQISLSPDGSQVAYTTPDAGQGSILMVGSVADGSLPHSIALADGKPNRMGRCGWVSNTRLVCSIFGVTDVQGRKINISRVFAIDADGNNVKQLSTKENGFSRGMQLFGGTVIDWLPDEDGAVLMAREHLPDDHTGSRLGSDQEGLGIDRIDTRTLTAHPVESPKRSSNEYISDGRGTIRIMGLAATTGGRGDESGVEHYLSAS